MLATVSDMLPRILGEHISTRIEIPPDLPQVVVDTGMIEQMLMNLAVNSRDAMPNGGTMTIEASIVDVGPEDLRGNQDARPGRFLCLTVSDTGCGIPPEILPRIFEPFFTTKPVGKGTGLGLATVYGIARQHNGWISVQSEVDKGTTFQVFLPCSNVSALASEAPPETEVPRSRGNETVLVVEDEEAVLHSATLTLRTHGYSVLTARNGVEALALWKGHREEIDLVLTDVVMPEGISGFELGRRLLADDPGLKIIFTSGYTSDLTGTRAPFPRGTSFIAKPYESEALLRALRKSLDDRAVSAAG
jgi:CheY-like chemotaxis protein